MCFAAGAPPGLISESASARWPGAADSIRVAAAARLKERTRPRTKPRLESGIFLMPETSLKKGRQGASTCRGLASARSFAIAPKHEIMESDVNAP